MDPDSMGTNSTAQRAKQDGGLECNPRSSSEQSNGGEHPFRHAAGPWTREVLLAMPTMTIGILQRLSTHEN